MHSIKRNLLTALLGGALLVVIASGAAYSDYTRTVDLLPRVMAARTCLQTAAAKFLPGNAVSFVDHYEEAYGALLKEHKEWQGVDNPLIFAALRAYNDTAKLPMSYEEFAQLKEKLPMDPKLRTCAASLGAQLSHWSNMEGSLKHDTAEHRYRATFYGKDYYKEWPAYIAD